MKNRQGLARCREHGGAFPQRKKPLQGARIGESSMSEDLRAERRQQRRVVKKAEQRGLGGYS